MVKFIKSLSMFLMIISSVMFTLIAYGEKRIPDEIVIVDDKEFKIEKVFTVKENNSPNEIQISTGISDAEKEYTLDISFLNIIPVKQSHVQVSKRHYVVPGGDIFGLKLYSNGVMIVGTSLVQTPSGKLNACENAGLQVGDIIISIDGIQVNQSTMVAEIFEKSGGKTLALKVMRNAQIFDVNFTPVLSSIDGKYKGGLWIRDSAAGIGTITYYDVTNGVFASLGHAVCDVDTSSPIPILNGEAVQARITGCYKGTSGTAGELCGVFSTGKIGSIMINGDTGVYGTIESNFGNSAFVPVATASEVRTGKAQIISTISGDEKEYYDIEITKIFRSDSASVRNMAVKITDPRLIEQTGGIVQGMSGSPIIQNGMLVGAITHVFINDALQGYAIFAENMINTSDYLYDCLNQKAS